jgi:Transcriptional regulator, AbiEi antitoxin
MRSKSQKHGPLADLAKKQHGVVALEQLERLGYSRHSAGRAVRSGQLHRLHRGVYAVGHLNLAWEGRCLAAVLACGPSAVASHYSAAWLWGLLRTRPGTLHVTAPKRRRQRAGFRLHFSSLAREDRSVCDGIPLTAVSRTVLDLAAVFDARRLERVLESSEELRIFDLRAVDALLARAGRHPGAGRLRRALAIYRDEPAFTRSQLERRFLGLVKAAGLPAPTMNFAIGEYELDAYWQWERFAVELDVYGTHGSRAAFERDRLRQEELKLRGIEMIRVTGSRLEQEPDTVVERVGALLRQRRRQLGLEEAA